ncbi:MAG: hypothetical protein HYU73_09260 [Betaproteobacteria bacterium]|nr:hypothetical protein [Betaproteobacteria bacterium]
MAVTLQPEVSRNSSRKTPNPGGQPELFQEDAEPEEGDSQNDKIRPGAGRCDVPAVEDLPWKNSRLELRQ